MVSICPEPAGAAGAVETLLDQAFGAARFLKTAERLREGRLPADGLSFIAADGGDVVGTIRFWSVRVGGGTPALLLGPVAVAKSRRARGIGSALIAGGLRQAARLGHGGVILVGDCAYYARFGFRRDLTLGMTLPGPVERARFLGRDLAAGWLAGGRGPIVATGQPQDPPFRRRQAAA